MRFAYPPYGPESGLLFHSKEKSSFRAFKLDHGTIVWPNELDLAAEYLFYLVFKEDDRYREQFRQWGYE
uniref:DUF2442 domain-containing protein n=1 Tax=Candidatus Kentrum sp. LPFa TaxID=2126335 RepID=A0A450VTY0_9GAMM|nr:MAG: Protein of unknown function (DUF2442) [Candidatus Kentron sp. LPFa]VFK24093.1 MAG: Protein of unknown function (DUF2442) [Candidatus Kentron sp. LPFa]